MAILTNSGRVVAAESVKLRPAHLAWGTGLVGWDAVPVPEGVGDTALVAEVGRRQASSVRYCEPDPTGEIIVPTGRFKEVLTPTRHLFFKFSFDFTDAPTATIREAAVFIGTETDPDLPPGQMYFEPGDLVSPGTLLVVERFEKFTRSPSVRQAFEFVVTF